MKRLYLIICFLPFIAGAQNQYHDLGFIRDTSIVVKHGNKRLLNAWAGGMSSVHFNSMDLNFNGKKDLVVFDKHGQRLRTYLNVGQAGESKYLHAPEYESAFPPLYGWMQLIDYDNDGKEDLFTYVPGAISVWRNVSTPQTGINFTMVTYMINSSYGAGMPPSNIMVTEDDYALIHDIDGDGALDILAFYGLGTYLHHHRNLSIDLHGTPGILDFKLHSPCWGRFAESEENNTIFLNQCMIWKDQKKGFDGGASKHMGATMLLVDLDSNGTYDLLLGDADHHILIALYNGNTNDSAVISHYDTIWPASMPINLVTFPVPSYVDINNDGVKDLLVSPFESTIFKADNTNNVWLYENMGTTANPVFEFRQKDFLQNQMIDVGTTSFPVLYDYDGDGLLDLFVGNLGYRDTSWYEWGSLVSKYRSHITLYKNTGTATQPEFTFVTDDFAGIKSMNIEFAYPTFGDLTGNGVADMLIGDSEGNVHFFTNNAVVGAPMDMVLTTPNFMTLPNSYHLTPVLIDLDGDSLLDIVMGKQIQQWSDPIGGYKTMGAISYYRNTGSATSPSFTLVTDSLGSVDVTDHYLNMYWAYSVPAFFKDSAGNLKLLVGGNTGLLFYYTDIENNIAGSFGIDTGLVFPNYGGDLYSVMFYLVNDSTPAFIHEGARSAPAVADLTGNGYPDLVVGNVAGGLTFFRGVAPPPRTVGIDKKPETFTNYAAKVYPNPAQDNISIVIPGLDGLNSVSIECYDLGGRLLKTHSAGYNHVYSMNVSDLNNGVYILRIKVSQGGKISGQANSKLIIKR